jgi:predicted O-methyltransferase YrrM
MPRIAEYFEALERLRKRGAVITADAVALEAGVGKKNHQKDETAIRSAS